MNSMTQECLTLILIDLKKKHLETKQRLLEEMRRLTMLMCCSMKETILLILTLLKLKENSSKSTNKLLTQNWSQKSNLQKSKFPLNFNNMSTIKTILIGSKTKFSQNNSLKLSVMTLLNDSWTVLEMGLNSSFCSISKYSSVQNTLMIFQNTFTQCSTKFCEKIQNKPIITSKFYWMRKLLQNCS